MQFWCQREKEGTDVTVISQKYLNNFLLRNVFAHKRNFLFSMFNVQLCENVQKCANHVCEICRVEIETQACVQCVGGNNQSESILVSI